MVLKELNSVTERGFLEWGEGYQKKSLSDDTDAKDDTE